MYYENYAPAPQKPKIDNIFSALVYEKTAGAILEFSLWCTVCVVTVMALIAAIIGEGNVTWILLMLFSAGMAVLMAFRLKPITMLYGAVTMNLLLFLIHFLCSTFYNDYYYYSYTVKYSVLNTLLFILLIITAIVLVVFAFIHFFSRLNFGNAVTILVLVHSSLVFFLQILMYACPFLGEYANDANEYARRYLNRHGYWLGTVSYWMMLVVVCLFYAFFFWGCIDSKKGKIINTNAVRVNTVMPGNMANAANAVNVANTGFVPALKGVAGMYAGQVIRFREKEMTIGSGQCHISIHDPFVSERHCSIRFNMSTGCYEVYDASGNGTYLHTGTRLQAGVYCPVQRGSILLIGSRNQQFQLL